MDEMESLKMGRCVHCLGEAAPESRFCPHCGKPARELDQPSFCLQPLSVLHGKYLVGRMLGQGGFGITYVGLDTVLDSKVAIKECFPQSCASRDGSVTPELTWSAAMLEGERWKASCGSFLKEARKMARMQDIPEIVRVQDTFEENNTAYIVMEFVEGITLKQELERNGLMTPAKCVAMLSPLLMAMEKVHKQGFVHRDISPDNIMLKPDGQLRLLDLGAAREISAHDTGASQPVTKHGFSPVEQYTEANIGSWTDVYAISATIYYCLTGRMIPSALDRANGAQLTMPPSIPPAVAAALRDGLAMRAEERIQSSRALLARLESAIRQPAQQYRPPQPPVQQQYRPVPPPVQPRPAPPPAPPVKKRGWIIPVVLVAAAAVIALMIVLWPKKEEPVTPPKKPDTTTADPGSTPPPEPEPEPEPEPLTVVRLGTSSTNQLNDGGTLEIPKKYKYFRSGDDGLYLVTYNDEDQTFYIDEGTRFCESGAAMTMSGEHVYFISTDYTRTDICQMDLDGGNVKSVYSTLSTDDLSSLQYAEFSDGREYLYFLFENEEEGKCSDLCRVDLSSGKAETLIDGSIFWYNLYEGSIYYTIWDFTGGDYGILERRDLDGKSPEVLNTSEKLLLGVIEGDTMYMWSDIEEALVAVDLDGKPKAGHNGFYGCDFSYTSALAVGDGWIYYSGDKDGATHRVRVNGTGDEVILEDHTPLAICYFDSWLWIYEQRATDKDHEYSAQGNFLYRDGSKLVEDAYSGLTWGLVTENAQRFTTEPSEDGAGVIVTGYTGTETRFTIPSYISGKPVVGVKANTFENNGVFEEIGFPVTMRTVGEYAFSKCPSLRFVGLNEGLETVEEGAFLDNAALSELDLPETLKTIGDMAFAETGFTDVYIPASVEDIGHAAFAAHSTANFTDFSVDDGNTKYTSVDGVLFSRNKKVLVAFPSGRSGSYTVPTGTMGLNFYAFAHCKNMIEVDLPDTITIVGDSAFWDSGVKQITVTRECQLPTSLGEDDIAVTYFD